MDQEGMGVAALVQQVELQFNVGYHLAGQPPLLPALFSLLMKKIRSWIVSVILDSCMVSLTESSKHLSVAFTRGWQL